MVYRKAPISLCMRRHEMMMMMTTEVNVTTVMLVFLH
jgi:hypothetical protein